MGGLKQPFSHPMGRVPHHEQKAAAAGCGKRLCRDFANAEAELLRMKKGIRRSLADTVLYLTFPSMNMMFDKDFSWTE